MAGCGVFVAVLQGCKHANVRASGAEDIRFVAYANTQPYKLCTSNSLLFVLHVNTCYVHALADLSSPKYLDFSYIILCLPISGLRFRNA